MVYSFQLGTRGLLCAASQRQDSTYYGLCYHSCGAVAGTSNSPMESQRGVKIKMARTYTIKSVNVILGVCEKRRNGITILLEYLLNRRFLYININ